jgi:hypothetical protein
MTEITDGWEIVSRRTNEPARHLLSMVLQIIFIYPETTGFYSSVTWTVRQTATGAVRKVTAWSEQGRGTKLRLEYLIRSESSQSLDMCHGTNLPRHSSV